MDFREILMAVSQGDGTAAAAGPITRLASRNFGPGHTNGTVRTVSTGAQATYTILLTNESGAEITEASLVFAGWGITTSGTQDIGNDVPVNGTIEYPSGTQVGDFGQTTVPDGGSIESTRVTLSASIPDGAQFRIRVDCTIANGLNYGATYLGLCGVNSTTTGAALVNEALYIIGDSIQTNNSSALMTAATGRCPAFQQSVSGTRAGQYTAVFATKHVPLAALMGITRFVSNFGTNDFSQGASAATLQTRITTFRDAAAVEGIAFTQSTITPSTSGSGGVSVTSATTTGGILSAVVADTAKFTVGLPYNMAGANEAAYNGVRFARSIDTGTNTITFEADASVGASATGTITLNVWKQTLDPNFMAAQSWEAQRTAFNDWCRSAANIDDFLEWADACEPSRGAGRWVTQGENALLPAIRDITVSSIITTTRFGHTSAGGNFPANAATGGLIQFRTGANPGLTKTITANGANDLTFSGAPTTPVAVNDTATEVGGTSYPSDDGLHPRVAGGSYGGQTLINTATVTWLLARLA